MTSRFSVLRIQKGVGSLHLNRYRLYFQSTAELQDLVRVLIEDFADYFDGDTPNTGDNLATVSRKGSWQSKPVLQFTMDARALAGFIDIPDLHDDWVAQAWKDPQIGWAAETLKREFDDGSDDIAKLVEFIAFVGQQTGIVMGLEYARYVNRHHFLAGRRSWIVKAVTADDAMKYGATRSSHIYDAGQTYYIETAAIERYSLIVYLLLSLDPIGFFVNPLRKSIDKIWTTMVRNFAKHIQARVISWPSSLHPNSLCTPWRAFGAIEPVYRAHGEFVPAATLSGLGWPNSVLTSHPALAEQMQHGPMEDEILVEVARSIYSGTFGRLEVEVETLRQNLECISKSPDYEYLLPQLHSAD